MHTCIAIAIMLAKQQIIHYTCLLSYDYVVCYGHVLISSCLPVATWLVGLDLSCT